MLSDITTQILLTGDPDHWGGPGGPGGPGAWWPIFPLLWFLLIAGAITAFVVTNRRRHRSEGTRAGKARLAERFAAGEIDETEYRERLAVLEEKR